MKNSKLFFENFYFKFFVITFTVMQFKWQKAVKMQAFKMRTQANFFFFLSFVHSIENDGGILR